MAFIRTTPVAEATGDVQAMFERSKEPSGDVPNYIEAFCHRPEVWNTYVPFIRSVSSGIDPRRYELVAVAAALALESSYCALAHGQALSKILGAEQTRVFARDFRQADLTAAEKVMVAYVQKVVRGARSVTQADVDELRSHGFSDTEIFEIALAATARCFIAKLMDAVGAEPDHFFTALEPELRQALTVGRDIEQSPSK
jgi:uncharacterized peroxidase-related enzyme